MKLLNFFIPIADKSSNWRCMFIQFPGKDFRNGLGNIFNWNEKNSSNLSIFHGATMWYAKLFGIIWNKVSNDTFTKDMVQDLKRTR